MANWVIQAHIVQSTAYTEVLRNVQDRERNFSCFQNAGGGGRTIC